MVHSTFNIQEYKEIILSKFLNYGKFDDGFEYLQSFIDEAAVWDRKLSGLNHFLSIILEQLEKNNDEIKEVQKIIDYVYDLQNIIDFEIQEGDVYYLENLFLNDHNQCTTLEEHLINAENRIYYDR